MWQKSFRVEVCFEKREDGGLRAWSPDVPLFVLSHSDHRKVILDVMPALETILSAQYGQQMAVAQLVSADEFVNKSSPPTTPPSRMVFSSMVAA